MMNMTSFEVVLNYICLLFATLMALVTKFGLDYIHRGDVVRGGLFMVIGILAIIGWVAPMIPGFRRWGIAAMRLLVFLITLWLMFHYLRETFSVKVPKPL
jgi:hypothetical protein